MRVEDAKVANCSFLHFVYPFTFRPDTFEARARAIDANAGVWLPGKFPVQEMLFHVADYLKPAEGKPRAARLWKLSEQNHNPLRLTRDLKGTLAANKQEIPFTFGGAQNNSPVVELALFSVGVGFLTVAARPTEGDAAAWLAFLHYFRVMNGSHNVSMRLVPPPDVKRAFYFASDDAQVTSYSHILQTLLNTAALPEDAKRWWYDVFVPGRMIPFGALFVDGLESEAERARLLYRVRNFFREEQIVIATPEELQIKNNPAYMPYAEGQQFVFSLQGGLFVAFDAPDTEFFRVTLPSHLRDEYFLVFLLTLYQRFTLMRLSQRVTERWSEGKDERATNFAHIREQFLEFSARGYFVQVMQRDHHHRFYRKWHEIFEMDQLYQEVREEVREIHEYLRMNQAERMQELQENQKRQLELAAREEARREHEAKLRREEENKRTEDMSLLIGSVGLGVAVPALTFGFLSINIQGYNLVVQTAAYIAAGAIFLSILIILIVWFGIRKRHHKRRRSSEQVSDAEGFRLP